MGEPSQGGVGQVLSDVLVDGMDEFSDEAISAVADLLSEEAFGVTKWAFDCLEELEQGDVFGGPGKFEAAMWTACGAHDTSPDQLLHDLGQMVFGDVECFGNLLIWDTLLRPPSQDRSGVKGQGGRLRNSNEIPHSGSSADGWKFDSANA